MSGLKEEQLWAEGRASDGGPGHRAGTCEYPVGSCGV